MFVRFDDECIRGVVVDLLEEAARVGDCYLTSWQLRAAVVDSTGVPQSRVTKAIRDLAAARAVVRRGERGQRVYLPRLDQAEHQCATGIARLLGVR